MKKVLALLLAILMVLPIFAGCDQTEIPEPTKPSDGSVPQAPVEEDQLKRLSLCITDNGAPNTKNLVDKRFDYYVEAGFLSVRLGGGWSTTASDQWTLAENEKNKYLAAKAHGMTVKMIPTTMMANPEYIYSDPGSRFVDNLGISSNANCISYWYEGLEEHTEKALRAHLEHLQEIDCLSIVDGIIVDSGAAGETIYPADWTQGRTETTMWCYADNAIADFRVKMEAQYGTIAAANAAWGTKYSSFAEVTVPKPGEAKGTYWRDTLNWYILAKRDAIEKQIVIYQKVLEEMGLEDIPLIIYLPGTYFTEAQFEECVATGTVNNAIMMGADNLGMVDLAAKYGCYLQYTGCETIGGVNYVRKYMYAKSLEYIPVFGENAAHDGLNAQLDMIFDNITDTNMAGIDFTNCSFLFDIYGEPNDLFDALAKKLRTFKGYVKRYDYMYMPDEYQKEAEQTGGVLQLELNINRDPSTAITFFFLNILDINYVVQPGDVLEYDVMLGSEMHGMGHVDACLGKDLWLRDFAVIDTDGKNCHPQGDLRTEAYGQVYHRTMRIGDKLSGRTIETIMLAAHPDSNAYEFYENGTYLVWYDNIRITNNGEVKVLIFADAADYAKLNISLRNSRDITGQLSLVDLEK